MFVTRSSKAKALFLTPPTFRWIFPKHHRNHSNPKSTDLLLIRLSRQTSSEHLETRVSRKSFRGFVVRTKYYSFGFFEQKVQARFYPRHVGDRSPQESTLFGENHLNPFPEDAETVEKKCECFDDVLEKTFERIHSRNTQEITLRVRNLKPLVQAKFSRKLAARFFLAEHLVERNPVIPGTRWS